MNRPTVYLETSVVSYATSRVSRDLVVAARQQITREWFASAASRHDIFVSQLVASEAAAGDGAAAKARVAFLRDFARLAVTKGCGSSATTLISLLNIDLGLFRARKLGPSLLPMQCKTQ